MAYAARRVEEQSHYTGYYGDVVELAPPQEEVSFTPHQLTQMLLDGAVHFTGQVVEAIESGNAERSDYYIGRSVAVLDGLCESLNREQGGELAENLEVVYLYAKQELFMAKERGSSETLRKVVEHITGVAESWRKIA